MRKLVITSIGAMALVAAVGGTALAAYTESPAPTEMVEGTGGQAAERAGEAALTGGDVSTGMIVVLALVAIGLVALLVARRRATESS